MPLRDVLAAALSRPAGKIVDGPVRDIIHEILSERGYASPAEVAALRAEADALRDQALAVEARAAQIEAQIAALREDLTALQQRPIPAPAPAPAPAATVAVVTVPELARAMQPTVPAPPSVALSARQQWIAEAAQRGVCKVLECGAPTRRDGFCVAHAETWRSGHLPGFISPEGLVRVGDAPRRVAPTLAGQAYAVEGEAVRVGGQQVPSVAY